MLYKIKEMAARANALIEREQAAMAERRAELLPALRNKIEAEAKSSEEQEQRTPVRATEEAIKPQDPRLTRVPLCLHYEQFVHPKCDQNVVHGRR